MLANRTRILAIAVLISVAAMAAAQEVHTDYDHHANFSQYHTYSWEKVKTTDPLWEPRIKDAVNRVLQAKGWQEVPQGQGQIALMAVGSTKSEHEYQTFYDGAGGWAWSGFGQETTIPINYRVGTLVVDMYGAEGKHLIWRSAASNTLSNKLSKNEKGLDKTVEKMFKDFPPKEKH
jgi:hypothetical protein